MKRLILKTKYVLTGILLGLCKLTEGLHWTEKIGFGIALTFWFTCIIGLIIGMK